MANILQKKKYVPFPFKSIKPEGWIAKQLKLQLDGLCGSLDKFWPDIADSKWIGGKTKGYEALPYWLDGSIPLAFLLDDKNMFDRVKTYIEYIISNQEENGWICPPRVEREKSVDRSYYDLWGFFLILKVLVVYYDAVDDERIENIVRRALECLDLHIDQHTLLEWGQMRWFECLIPIIWLYERTQEEWLVDLAIKLHSQGFEWKSFFENWPMKDKNPHGRWNLMSHVVNNAMAIKSNALWWLFTGCENDLTAVYDMIYKLDKYHGTVTGVFTGDECLAGISPIQGTELCAIVEYMYSLETLLSIMGNVEFADRLEKITFNCLPATLSPDMWTHQYVQQVNQIECSIKEKPHWTTNGPDANIFGLEPEVACCTSNFPQGWPEFALSTFMKLSDEEGIASLVHAPVSLKTEIRDVRVSITSLTDYPFDNMIEYIVRTEKTVKFPFVLRIPSWASGASVSVGGVAQKDVKPGNLYRLDREWEGETHIVLNFPMEFRIEERPQNLFALVSGPLVYSIKVGERWERINDDIPLHQPPHSDYELYATTPWNYGLILDKEQPNKSLIYEKVSNQKHYFSPDGTPIKVKAKGRKVKWDKIDGSCAREPDLSQIGEEVEEVELIPYGCTNLRITEFPLLCK